MDVSSINSDLIRGNVTTIILKALIDEDRYGYDILREIEVKSGGQYKLKQPTLYSCLKRLEKQGLISSYWGDESDTEGGRRRYYALTDAGRGYLDKMQSEYEYSRTILDSLLSENKFDFESKDAPFDINSLRPYTKRSGDDEEVAQAPAPAQTVVQTPPTPIFVEEKGVAQNAPVQNTKMPEPIFSAEKSAPVYEKAEQPTVNADAYKPRFAEGSSYDESYRHTSSSFREMLGKIDDILNKKPADETPAEPEKPAETAAKEPEKVETVVAEEKIEEIKKPLSILGEKPNPAPAPITEADVEAERQRRADAKRALYMGTYNDGNALKTYEEAQKKSVEISAEEPEVSTRELLFGNKTEQKPAEKPVEPRVLEERSKSHELLFGNRDAAKAEPLPETKSPLPDSKLIFDKYNKKEEPVVNEPIEKPEPKKVIAEKSPVPPASTFSFRKDVDSVVNYRDAFSSLRQSDSQPAADATSGTTDIQQKPASSIDLKTKLFSEGYKLRAYSRENTENYYSLNYIKKNRINRDCYALLYVLICAEVFIGWLIFKERFSAISYAAICIASIVIPAIPFVIWSVNPDKRVRANYNFRTSILNRLMLYLNLLVIDCLVGFFGLGANINDGATMVAPILIPALLMLNIPFSSVIYLILYKTKKYHIS